MYFALYDEQTHEYMHSGLNAESESELKEALITFVEPDLDEEEMEHLKRMSVYDIAEGWMFSVEKQTTKFEERE